MYRYRYDGGASRKVDTSVIHRLGTLRRVVAKRFQATRSTWYTEVYHHGELIWSNISTRALKKFLQEFDMSRIEIRKRKSSWTTTYEVLMVYGDEGTARFSGVCWGYLGEGPRTTKKILTECGVPDGIASDLAFHSQRQQSVGVDWEVDLDQYRHQLAS